MYSGRKSIAGPGVWHVPERVEAPVKQGLAQRCTFPLVIS